MVECFLVSRSCYKFFMQELSNRGRRSITLRLCFFKLLPKIDFFPSRRKFLKGFFTIAARINCRDLICDELYIVTAALNRRTNLRFYLEQGKGNCHIFGNIGCLKVKFTVIRLFYLFNDIINVMMILFSSI